VAFACSCEWVEGRVWAWSGTEGRDRGLLAVKPKGLARGDCVVRGLVGFPLEATTRRTRGNSAVWARGGLMGPPTRPPGPE
jgi:hypothetical protein